MFGQVFALARISGRNQPELMLDRIMTAVRALLALPFVVVLPLWSLTLRLLTLGAIGSTGTVYWSVFNLVMTPDAGRGTADVALFAGLVAGAELPFMLMLPLLTRGMTRPVAMLLDTGMYLLHLLSLPQLAGPPLVWALVLPAAAGGAYILTLPIAHLQDMLAARPGTGSALISLQKLIGDLMAATCFALGTALSGYALVTALGTAAMLTGAVALVLADRRKPGTPAGGPARPGLDIAARGRNSDR